MAGIVDAQQFRQPLLDRGRHCGGATDIGTVRNRNEDAYWIARDGQAMAVGDGLGGLPAGDVASALAVAAVAEFLERSPAAKQPRSGWVQGAMQSRGGSSPAATHSTEKDATGHPAELSARVCEAAAHAQHVVMDASHRTPSWRGMATTLVIALIDHRTAAILQVGDSRAALWRGRRCVCTTIDQNAAGDLVRAGVLTPEQARRHPSRTMVREVIGRPQGYQPEIDSWEMEGGDMLLLFTDGVSEGVPDHEIARILATSADAPSAAASLVAAAAAGGGHDNATAIVRHVT